MGNRNTKVIDECAELFSPATMTERLRALRASETRKYNAKLREIDAHIRSLEATEAESIVQNVSNFLFENGN